MDIVPIQNIDEREFLRLLALYIEEQLAKKTARIETSSRYRGQYVNLRLSNNASPYLPTFLRYILDKVIECKEHTFRVSNWWSDSRNTFIVLWKCG